VLSVKSFPIGASILFAAPPTAAEPNHFDCYHRETYAWSSWVSLAGGVEIERDRPAARAGTGGEVTFPLDAQGDHRLGPTFELGYATLTKMFAQGGVELMLGGLPDEPLGDIGRSHDGYLFLRGTLGITGDFATGKGAPVFGGAVGWGFRTNMTRVNSGNYYRICTPEDVLTHDQTVAWTHHGSGYRLGARFVVSAFTERIDGSYQAPTLLFGVEIEPATIWMFLQGRFVSRLL